MTFLIFDTETTGLPNYRLPQNHPAQPHIVQLAALQVNDRFEIEQQYSMIIRPPQREDGTWEYEIPKEASDIHRVTHERACEYGISINSAMSVFNGLCKRAGCLVAHNIRFDLYLIRTALARLKAPDRTLQIRQLCTMDATRDIVKCPPTPKMIAAGIEGYKVPKLEEAYEHFYGTKFDGAHDALNDCVATLAVLKKVLHKD